MLVWMLVCAITLAVVSSVWIGALEGILSLLSLPSSIPVVECTVSPIRGLPLAVVRRVSGLVGGVFWQVGQGIALNGSPRW